MTAVLSRLRVMLFKEFLQLFRDKRSRFVLIVPPIVQMLIFGYAATYQVRNVPMAVLDLDHSQESRELITGFEASPYFQVERRVAREQELSDLIYSGDATLALQIHAGFAERLRSGQTAPVQLILDGTNSNTALIAGGYASRIADRFAHRYEHDRLQRTQPMLAARLPAVEVESRPWFNENLLSQWFFVPGVIGSLTLVMVVNLTAFAVVREREIGTLEQIMVTPIRRTEFILGKTVPFFLIGLADVAMIAAIGTLWFQIPFRGSMAVLFLGTVFYLLCMLGVGLLISTVSATQQQAMVSAFFVLMPAITFSGFGFPIASIPEPLRQLTVLNPLRHFLVVIRGIYLKGVGLDVLWPQMLAMAGFAIVLLGISVLRFHKSLD